jgi:hypothetical protein
MLPCFSQGARLCGAVAVKGSVSCVCIPSSDAVGALVFGVSARAAMMCGALFIAMLVSGVPTCTECAGWGIGISVDGIVVTKCLALAALVSTMGSEVLHYLFVLEEDYDLVVF